MEVSVDVHTVRRHGHVKCDQLCSCGWRTDWLRCVHMHSTDPRALLSWTRASVPGFHEQEVVGKHTLRTADASHSQCTSP